MKGMTLGKKLGYADGLAALFLLVAIAASISAIRTLERELNYVADGIAKKTLLCGKLQSFSTRMRGAGRGAILYSTSDLNNPEFATRSARRDFGPEFVAINNRSFQLAERLNQATEVLVKAQSEAFESVQERARQIITGVWYRVLPLAALGIAAFVAAAAVVFRSARELREAAGPLAMDADQVASAAAEVPTASQSLARGASEQAASLEQTSASSEEINAASRANLEKNERVAREMTKTADLIARANTQLDQLLESMQGINNSSAKISKIINVIDEIAFQTNILALNAAVEAARAGHAGMGFAVVADEVRTLAQRSATAAKDTALLIKESIEKCGAGSRNVDLVSEQIRVVTATRG